MESARGSSDDNLCSQVRFNCWCALLAPCRGKEKEEGRRKAKRAARVGEREGEREGIVMSCFDCNFSIFFFFFIFFFFSSFTFDLFVWLFSCPIMMLLPSLTERRLTNNI